MANDTNAASDASGTDDTRVRTDPAQADWLNLIGPIHSTIIGTGGDDKLDAKAEGDVVYGLAGDDTLNSKFNHTALIGGRGHDTLDQSVSMQAPLTDSGQVLTGNALADGGAGDDTINATVKVGGHTEAGVTLKTDILGGSGDDTIHATADGTGANGESWVGNTVDGGGGNDHITVFAQTDGAAITGTVVNTVDGGDGNDVIDATANGNPIYGPVVENSLHGGRGDDVVHAVNFTGSDSMYGTGVNQLWGDEGNDTLDAVYDAGDNGVANLTNYLDGGTGDDHLTAKMTARDGSITAVNHLEGGTGRDTLSARIDAEAPGGLGNADLYHLSNILNGGAGDDALEAFLSVKSVPLPGDNSFAENRLDGGTGNDTLTATVATGSPGTSYLSGGTGNDRLTVIGGTDNVLDGGAGKDTLFGGTGDDHMLGGSGADAFVFAPTTGHDTIGDFETGRDRIDLTAFAADNIHSFADLSGSIAVSGGDSVIHFGAADDITVKGVTDLKAGDFLFA